MKTDIKVNERKGPAAAQTNKSEAHCPQTSTWRTESKSRSPASLRQDTSPLRETFKSLVGVVDENPILVLVDLI